MAKSDLFDLGGFIQKKKLSQPFMMLFFITFFLQKKTIICTCFTNCKA